MATRKFVVSEIPGRRYPWRVHRHGSDPKLIAQGAFTSEAEARELADRLNGPMEVFPVTLADARKLGKRLATRNRVVT